MKEAKNELMQFVAGIIMLVVGLYIFSQKVIVFQAFLIRWRKIFFRFNSCAIDNRHSMDVCQRCEISPQRYLQY